MSLKTSFIAELKFESLSTKKLLERVPLENAGWKPHEKSMSIGRLATHIAEIPVWITRILSADDYDFGTNPYNPYTASDQAELTQIFESNLSNALQSLEQATDEEFDKIWAIKRNGAIMGQMPKKIAIRSWGISHLVHHRGQLSVFLRMQNIPIPGMYGPSADER